MMVIIVAMFAQPCDIAYMVVFIILLRADVMILLNRSTAQQALTMLFSIDILFVVLEAVQRTFAVFPCLDILVLQFLEIERYPFYMQLLDRHDLRHPAN